MASARNKAPRRVGVWRGCPLPTTRGVWGGSYISFPEMLKDFELKITSFGAF